VDADGLGQVGRCTRCGAVQVLKLPMSLKAAVMYMRAFVEEHSHCEYGLATVPTASKMHK
jgi:hypothetical protein